MQRRCTAATKGGAPCRSFALPESTFCVTHSPAHVTDLAAWRRAGGRGKGNRRRAKRAYEAGALSPREVEGLIGSTMRAVLTGAVSPGQAQAVASLARAAMHVKEASEVEERLSALEAAAGAAQGRTA